MIKWNAKYQVSTKSYSYDLVMDAEIAIYLLGPLKRELKHVARLYEKYKDIHESGEATKRQQTMMVKYEDQLRMLDMIISVIEPRLKD